MSFVIKHERWQFRHSHRASTSTQKTGGGISILTQALISNLISSKVWDEITFPLLNFNGWTVYVWVWISNFMSHFIIGVITYLCYVGINSCW